MESETDGGAPALTFDWTVYREPSLAVVDAVGALRNEPAENLPPLQGSVDAGSLDALIDHLRHGESEGTVRFEYVGFCVVIASDGDGRVYEDDEVA